MCITGSATMALASRKARRRGCFRFSSACTRTSRQATAWVWRPSSGSSSAMAAWSGSKVAQGSAQPSTSRFPRSPAVKKAVIRAAAEIPNELRVCGAVVSTTSTSLGQDAGELAGIGRLDVRVTDDLAAALARAEIVIDFSQPHATRSHLAVCRAARKPLLIGTTGFPAELTSLFDAAAADIPPTALLESP